MTEIATSHIDSAAPPSAFFDIWADMATWPEWNGDTEWVRLDGPFLQGARGRLKPRGGPSVPFTIEVLNDSAFVDVSALIGARLVFDHRVTASADGTRIDVTITIDGLLGRLWRRIMGADLASSLEGDLRALAARAEARVAAGAA
jgi:hypothetical protein